MCEFHPEIVTMIALLLKVPVLTLSKHLLFGFCNRVYLGNFCCCTFLVFTVFNGLIAESYNSFTRVLNVHISLLQNSVVSIVTV